MAKTKVVWSIKEFTKVLRQRQLNKFDANISVSGKRGDGKSTLLWKIFHCFIRDGFNQKKHQVYSRDNVIKLLANQKLSFCWDDEAINSGYKRDFQSSGQKDLIKVVTNYRDNFNIYASALPFFYSLDKDLRELIFCHIHIIERGVGVILLPIRDQIHGTDPWDAKTNQKIEVKENNRLKANPNLRFRYHKLTTFGGYIYFGDMTDKQRKRYEKIKSEKRAKNFAQIIDDQEASFYERMYNLLIEKKLTRDGMIQACLIEGKKHSSTVQQLNTMLKDRGLTESVKHFYREGEIKSLPSSHKTHITNLVPKIVP